MRNIQRLHELADFIESAKFKFDMADDSANPSCGSAGCIGGHAAMLWPEVRIRYSGGGEDFTWGTEKICEHLGLTPEEESNLFFPREMAWTCITREMAVDTVRRFAATGIICFEP